jgi:hypothetical protein
MNKLIPSVKTKFMVAFLALFIWGFFLVAPASAQQAYSIEFWADRSQIWAGECVNIYWDTDNVQSVYYNGQPVSGIDQTQIECPASSTVYNLLVNTKDGQQLNKQIYVQVSEPPTGWVNPNTNMIIDFSADRTRIQAGECLNIYWNTANVRSVYYNGEGVSGVNQTRQECPSQDTVYTLLINTRDGQQINRQIYVDVTGSSYESGTLEMEPGKIVDFDENGDVSDNEDDFVWVWGGGERGRVVKVDDDDDLRLARVETDANFDRFESLSLDECRDRLDDDDETQIAIQEDSIVCVRTDDGVYGKFWVDDIRSANGELEVDWYIWK